MSLKIQIMYLLLILLILQGCQAQDKKKEMILRKFKKTPILPVKSYTGIVDFRNAKIATPGVVNIKSLLNLKGNNIKMSFNLSIL
jgi:hypothetical protein